MSRKPEGESGARQRNDLNMPLRGIAANAYRAEAVEIVSELYFPYFMGD
jgi:hypothetical protein